IVPEAFERLYNQAVTLNRQRQPHEAVRILKGLEQTEHHRAAVVGMLGTILLYDLNDVDTALPPLRESGAPPPRSQVSSLALYHALMRKGERALALAEARRFLGLKPSSEYTRLLEGLDDAVAVEAPRLVCFLLVDTSGSLEPLIDGLCRGLRDLKIR